jgi:aspartyl protease family protein
LSNSNPDHNSKKVGTGMMVLAWLLVMGLLTYLFDGWLGQQQNPNQQVSTHISIDGLREVVLQRNQYGHYLANGKINNQNVVFLLDTGATMVAIPTALAQRLQLQVGTAQPINTANGISLAYNTRLKQVSISDISLTDIPAVISPGLGGEQALLGMSFLKHIEFSQRNDSLILRQNSPYAQ